MLKFIIILVVLIVLGMAYSNASKKTVDDIVSDSTVDEDSDFIASQEVTDSDMPVEEEIKERIEMLEKEEKDNSSLLDKLNRFN